jgi:hypothetical protein
MEDGGTMEVAAVGPEGLVGIGAALGRGFSTGDDCMIMACAGSPCA